jgi:hypothetical protein
LSISDFAISELVKLGVALLGFAGTSLTVLRIYLLWRRRMVAKQMVIEKNLNKEKAAREILVQQARERAEKALLDRFERDIDRHEKKLDENTKSQAKLSEDMASVKAQLSQVLENQPKFLEMMGKFIQSLRKQGMKTQEHDIGGTGLVRVSESDDDDTG